MPSRYLIFSFQFLRDHARFRVLDAAGLSFFVSALTARLPLMILVSTFLRSLARREPAAYPRAPQSGLVQAAQPTGRRSRMQEAAADRADDEDLPPSGSSKSLS